MDKPSPPPSPSSAAAAPSSSSLQAIAGGKSLEPDASRGLWSRFSAHMDDHEGDFSGFAETEGYRFAQVEVVDGAAVLSLSQVPFAKARGAGPSKPRSGGRKRKSAAARRRRRKRKKAAARSEGEPG